MVKWALLSNKMKPVKALLFDLGNVLLPIDLVRSYEAFSALSSNYSALQIEQITQEEGLWRAYEAGLVDEDTFRLSIQNRFQFSCSDETFDQAFNALILGFHGDVYELLADLAKQFDLYLLSNTSSIHARVFMNERVGPEGQHVFDLFKKIYLSFEMGLIKPDPRIYEQVLIENNLLASEVMFFDDNFSNIESAKRVGVQAILIDPISSLSQIRQILQSYVN